MRVHNIAVVGCGAMATMCHLPNITTNPRLKLVTTCDINETAARSACEQFHAQKYCTDWHDVIADQHIDLILVATHTNLRAEIIVAACKAGKAVYVEKPLADSIEGMEQIAGAVNESNVAVTVGHNRRSSPAILEFKRLIEKARLCKNVCLPSYDRSGGGRRTPIAQEKSTQLLIRINDDCRTWKDWIFSDSEGIAFAEMVHFVDLALWLNNSNLIKVYAEGFQQGNFTFIMRFEDGSIATLQHSLIGHFDYPKELMEVSVNHVSIACDYCLEVRQRGLPDEPFSSKFQLTSNNGSSQEQTGIAAYHSAVDAYLNSKSKEQLLIFPNKGHYAHLNRWIDSVEGISENPCDVDSAIWVTKINLKFLESIKTGQPLNIKEEILS